MPWPDPATAITDPFALPVHCGLGSIDEAIYEQALRLRAIVPSRVWCNLVVGAIDPRIMEAAGPAPDERLLRTWQKRPDLAIEEHGQLFIVEIKPAASRVALGQALMYAALARDLPDPIARPTPMILTDLADPDLVRVAPALGVTLRQLGDRLIPRPDFPT